MISYNVKEVSEDLNLLEGIKVCHLSTVHEGHDPRIRERECVGLAGAGAEVHLFIANDRDELYKKVIIHSISKPSSRIIRYLNSQKVSQRILKLKPHIIHFHDLELIRFMLAIKNKYEKIKIIFDCHEDSISHINMKDYLPKFTKPILTKIVERNLKQAALNFDAIITADDGVSDMFSQWGANPVTLYNFPPKNIYQESPDWNFSNRPFDIIYPGSTPRYHLETMFSIANELKKKGIQTKWLILANLYFKDANVWINQKISKFGLQDCFEFKPLVAYSELVKYLQQAKIGIIPLPDVPKFHKNIPSKMFDFFMAGLPVVLSDLPPSRKFIESFDIAVPVKADNIEAFALAIGKLLIDNNKMVEIGKNAREFAFHNYYWEKELFKLIELYTNLL